CPPRYLRSVKPDPRAGLARADPDEIDPISERSAYHGNRCESTICARVPRSLARPERDAAAGSSDPAAASKNVTCRPERPDVPTLPRHDGRLLVLVLQHLAVQDLELHPAVLRHAERGLVIRDGLTLAVADRGELLRLEIRELCLEVVEHGLRTRL